MPRASKHPINKNIQEELQDNFSLLISSLSSSSDIQHFFETFLTEEEKIMLTKRLMVHLMIESGYSPQEIITVVGVSKDTVFKHKIISKTGDITYKTIIGKIITRRKTKEFLKKIENILRPIGTIMEARTNMKARSKLMFRDID